MLRLPEVPTTRRSAVMRRPWSAISRRSLARSMGTSVVAPRSGAGAEDRAAPSWQVHAEAAGQGIRGRAHGGPPGLVARPVAATEHARQGLGGQGPPGASPEALVGGLGGPQVPEAVLPAPGRRGQDPQVVVGRA